MIDYNSIAGYDILSEIDADNLDAIGAVGLVRTYQYGFAHNVKGYDPSVPLYHNKYEEGMVDASTIHHIHNKLLRLGEYMNTKTAKKLAKKKIKLMKNFIDMYISESKGEF